MSNKFFFSAYLNIVQSSQVLIQDPLWSQALHDFKSSVLETEADNHGLVFFAKSILLDVSVVLAIACMHVSQATLFRRCCGFISMALVCVGCGCGWDERYKDKGWREEERSLSPTHTPLTCRTPLSTPLRTFCERSPLSVILIHIANTLTYSGHTTLA